MDNEERATGRALQQGREEKKTRKSDTDFRQWNAPPHKRGRERRTKGPKERVIRPPTKSRETHRERKGLRARSRGGKKSRGGQLPSHPGNGATYPEVNWLRTEKG